NKDKKCQTNYLDFTIVSEGAKLKVRDVTPSGPERLYLLALGCFAMPKVIKITPLRGWYRIYCCLTKELFNPAFYSGINLSLLK
ncbi:MAG TPA: hypothetical protein PLC17_08655, partial [Tenuifilaceae bacterium]|nr:hypothetical protein [Tenuifilaceae bacterium]